MRLDVDFPSNQDTINLVFDNNKEELELVFGSQQDSFICDFHIETAVK